MKTCHVCGYQGPDEEFIRTLDSTAYRCNNVSECYKRFYFKLTGIDFSTKPVEEQVEILKDVELMDILIRAAMGDMDSTEDEMPPLTKEKAEELLQSFVKKD